MPARTGSRHSTPCTAVHLSQPLPVGCASLLDLRAASAACRPDAAGYHKFVIAMFDIMGIASLNVTMGINGSAYAPVPMARVYPVQPGAATPVSLSVNGVAAQPLCGASGATTLSAAPAVFDISPPEPTSVPVPAGSCAYLYSSHRTPVLISAVGLSADASNTAGMGPSGLAYVPSTGQLQVGGRSACNATACWEGVYACAAT